MSNQSANNTDVELWRTTEGDYYSRNKIYATETGGITICDGGFCTTMPAYEWWALANPGGKDSIVKRLHATTEAPRVDEREAFEREAKAVGLSLSKNLHGSYLNNATAFAFRLWRTQPPVEAPAPVAIGEAQIEAIRHALKHGVMQCTTPFPVENIYEPAIVALDSLLPHLTQGKQVEALVEAAREAEIVMTRIINGVETNAITSDHDETMAYTMNHCISWRNALRQSLAPFAAPQDSGRV